MSDAELEEIAPSLHPLVLINRTTAAAGVPSLVVDYGQGVQDLAEHLVGLGHTRLAFLAGPAGSASNGLRLEGLEAFRAAIRRWSVSMLDGGSDFDTGHEAVDAVLESGATGILAFNDLVAMGLMSGLHERGVQRSRRHLRDRLRRHPLRPLHHAHADHRRRSHHRAWRSRPGTRCGR